MTIRPENGTSYDGTAALNTYDANGNQTNTVDALSRANRFEFDALNRQVKITYPDNTTEHTGYDALDRRIAVTNQADVVTRFGYDALGRLVAVTNAFGTSEQLVTRYDYDELGNLLRQIDGLNRTNKFEYDALGRRTKETLPQGQSQSFGYDAVGNLRFHTNFNSVILTNTYDALNRLTNKVSTGYQVAFAYNATGQRTNMVDASGTTSYTYDTRDRLLSKTTPQGKLNYTYGDYGNLQAIASTTSDGVSLGYTYDDLNRVTNVTQSSASVGAYSFDAVGNLETLRSGNAVTNTYTYNSLNRLTNLSAKAASGTLANFTYKLAAAGNRTNLIESVNGTARTNVWSYDALYRLTNEVVTGASPTGTNSYKYDTVGNRTNRTSSVSGVTNQTFTYNGNDWLTGDVYDSNGNTRTNGANTYAYDVENRLTNSVTTGTNIVMIYNGDGLRVAKTVGSTTTLYLLDDRNPTGYAQVLEELTVSGGVTNLSKVFTYGLDLISQRQAASGTTHYYGHDGNGNARYLTDTSATVSDTYFYEAFGTVIATTGTTPNDYRYSGEQNDPNLGFTYLRARYLNTGTGRFWTRDTYEGDAFDPPSLHRYTYGHDDPVNHVDPSGRDIGESIAVLTIASIVINSTFLVVDTYRLTRAVTTQERAYYSSLIALDSAGLFLGIWGGGGGPRMALAGAQGGSRLVTRVAVEKAIAGSAAIATTHVIVSASSSSEILGKSYNDLVKDAEKAYPNKVGKPDEDHHVVPKYLGGDPKGPTVKLPAPYHQLITSEFRRQYGYGQTLPNPERLAEIMEQVYKKYPLPPNP